MNFNLKKILTALLLSSTEPLSLRTLQEAITDCMQAYPEEDLAPAGERIEEQGGGLPFTTLVTVSHIREALESLRFELDTAEEAYRILELPAGYRIAIAPAYAEWVRHLRNDPKPAKLSQSALETLSLIAYRQPITRPEMEAVRGVSVDGSLQRLLELELIRVAGKSELPGRPFQYSTTVRFLELCGITTLADLPQSDAFSKADLDQLIAKSIYSPAALTSLPEVTNKA